MPTIINRGGLSAQGYGFGASSAQAVYVEDVFSTYLYTGTGATRSITNNINLSTNGGLTWIKDRQQANSHALFDTVRGANKYISSDLTIAQDGYGATTDSFTSFNTNGFSLGADSGLGWVNSSNVNYVSWTFREQAKFFDVVSYTGTGSARTIAHNLGATPGMIIVKRTDTTANWRVYHSGLTSASYYMALNTTAAQALGTTIWNATAPTSSVFSVGTDATVNASGGTYIAYLFASNAGGFGSAGTDNVITCGSYTGNGSTTGPSVSLGYEPQYIFIRRIDSAGAWNCGDNMRGVFTGSSDNWLELNIASTEYAQDNLSFTATGFQLTSTNAEFNASGGTYIYMAIRRGPMKTPTSGTSVFSPITSSAAAGTDQTTNFVVDTQIAAKQSGADTLRSTFNDRLRGNSSTTSASGRYLVSSSLNAEATTSATTRYWNNTGFQNPTYYGGVSSIYWSFGRAPGFFDVVCYTGTGSVRTVSHNLGVAPALMIVKSRSRGGEDWPILSGQSYDIFMYLNQSIASTVNIDTYNCFGNGSSVTPPTSSVFTVGTQTLVNANGDTYVAYLVATLAGVSKVGSYTGTAAALNIDCGFAAGARFVMIKRTDSTGDWYVWDSARGISASGTNDPYLLFNSSAAEVTNTDYLGTYSSGFALTSSAPAALNASGGSYIFLAIA